MMRVSGFLSFSSWLHGARNHRIFVEFLCIQIVIIVVAVLTRVTLSSYGITIEKITGDYGGLLLGLPSPIRSDEYGVLTPLIQSTLLSGQSANNAISLYGESLLGPFAMPIFDWGLIFKPQFWLFFISPEIGFSYYHLFFISMVIWGWYLLFRDVLDCRPVVSVLASLCIFSSPLLQYVFTTHGQSLAFAPILLWILFSEGSIRSTALRTLAAAYIATCLAISDFYPPYFIQYLILAGLLHVTVILKRKDFRQPFKVEEILCYLGACVGVSVAVFYLYEMINILGSLPHVSDARFEWGKEPFLRKIAEVMPSMGFNLRQNFFALNAVEAASMGSIFMVPALALAIAKRHLVPVELLVLVAAYLILSAFQVTQFGKIIEHVPGLSKLSNSRSFLLSGILSVIIGFVFIESVLRRDQFFKYLQFVYFVFLGVLVLKAWAFGFQAIFIETVAVCFCLPILWYLMRLDALDHLKFAIPLTLAILIQNYPGALVNPLQRADEIFSLKDHKNTLAFAEAAKTEKGIIVDTIFAGGTWSGLGFKSYSHVIPNPDVNSVSETLDSILKGHDYDRNHLAKWLHIRVGLNFPKPLAETFADAVTIGAEFIDDEQIVFQVDTGINDVDYELSDPTLSDIKVFTDNLIFNDSKYCVLGWAAKNSKLSLDQAVKIKKLSIYNNGRHVNSATVDTFQRWDIVKVLGEQAGMFSGFKICAEEIFDEMIFKIDGSVMSKAP